jgi:hypothetical protein
MMHLKRQEGGTCNLPSVRTWPTSTANNYFLQLPTKFLKHVNAQNLKETKFAPKIGNFVAAKIILFLLLTNFFYKKPKY